ncbi:MAG: glucose-6-phosphate isomerase [Sphingomonadaceae bacterium]
MTSIKLPHETAAWAALQALDPVADIGALFTTEADRLGRLVVEVAGIRFDGTKLPLAAKHMAALLNLAAEVDVAAARTRLVAGDIVNPSEGRAATHMALRDPAIRHEHAPMRAVAEKIRGGGFGPVRHIIHIGIGGSALGPQLLIDALGRDGDGPEVHVAANIDGLALARAFAACNPQETLLIAVSKTFTTLETLTNLQTACDWLEANGVASAKQRVIAVTAAPARALGYGVSPDAILDFAETVGGRYSLWSAVGLPLAIRNGWDDFAALLDGAYAMDRHFVEAPFAVNAPVLAALADVWAATFQQKPTRAVFAYDERLRLIPAWLQQLEMESNGKSVTSDGRPLSWPTAPITWGGTGTDAQHAVFQLLHQGTHTDPIEFLAVATPGHDLNPVHHQLLLANCFAQGAALLRGRTEAEALAAADGDPALAAAKSFPGNRGSSTLLIDRLTPDRLGALLAFYEARTFVAATLLGINPFDQWGVELGKAVANALTSGQDSGVDPGTAALLTAAARYSSAA